MALTNVWTRSKTGEWTRTTAQESERLYGYSVSVHSHQFRCYSCFQYVSFVHGSIARDSHFRHSSSYSDKDCEDRSINTMTGSARAPLSNVSMPMRLILDRTRPLLFVGMQPIGMDELRRCISAHMQITLINADGESSVYRVDENRFVPNSTTWLPVPLSGSDRLHVTITPPHAVPRVWSGSLDPISARGALFDAYTGKRVADKGDVVVGREYFWLFKRNRVNDGYSSDVQLDNIYIQDRIWSLYRVKAKRFTESASNFFFEYLGTRLTNYPVDMAVLWPPVLVKDDIIETNSRAIQLLKKGEADFVTYPRYATSCKQTNYGEGVELIEISSMGTLQMVTNERYNQTLQFMYVRPIERHLIYSTPELEVSLDNGELCSDTAFEKVPLRGILHFKASDDGAIDVYEEDEFLYRKNLAAGERTRITDLKKRMRLTVRIGLEHAIEVTIMPKRPENIQLAPSVPALWCGPMVRFPRRYAWILTQLEPKSELYNKTMLALLQGSIPKDGLQMLQQRIEENTHDH